MPDRGGLSAVLLGPEDAPLTSGERVAYAIPWLAVWLPIGLFGGTSIGKVGQMFREMDLGQLPRLADTVIRLHAIGLLAQPFLFCLLLAMTVYYSVWATKSKRRASAFCLLAASCGVLLVFGVVFSLGMVFVTVSEGPLGK